MVPTLIGPGMRQGVAAAAALAEGAEEGAEEAEGAEGAEGAEEDQGTEEDQGVEARGRAPEGGMWRKEEGVGLGPAAKETEEGEVEVEVTTTPRVNEDVRQHVPKLISKTACDPPAFLVFSDSLSCRD